MRHHLILMASSLRNCRSLPPERILLAMINKHLGVKSINLKCVRVYVCVCVCVCVCTLHVCVFVEAVEVE